MNLSINKQYSKLVPNPSDSDRKQLYDSIKKEGYWQHMPLISNERGEILDGHHRFQICNELNITPTVKTVNFKNPEIEEPLFILNNTLKRRQLTPMQRIEIAKNARKYFAKLGKERMSMGGRLKSDMEKKGFPTSGNLHTDKEIAKMTNTGHDTVHKANVILAKGTEEQKDKVRSGKASINHAYNSIMNKKRHTETPELPAGKYDIIYADPPWEYSNGGNGSAANHYSTMPTEEIAAVKVPAAEDAMLFLWGTIPNLEAAIHVIGSWGFRYVTDTGYTGLVHKITIHVIGSWGFRYVTAIAWIKNRSGTGFYVRGKFEMLLIAKRGRMPVPMEDSRPENVISVQESEHSSKPGEFYSIIERMYPNRKYLELFARNTRKGWKSWGNEVK